jgi:hypothetical protein
MLHPDLKKCVDKQATTDYLVMAYQVPEND